LIENKKRKAMIPKIIQKRKDLFEKITFPSYRSLKFLSNKKVIENLLPFTIGFGWTATAVSLPYWMNYAITHHGNGDVICVLGSILKTVMNLNIY
jgi:uncharacterized membrane protein